VADDFLVLESSGIQDQFDRSGNLKVREAALKVVGEENSAGIQVG
jgi:hypothetical protein